jgi:hypothetical protein
MTTYYLALYKDDARWRLVTRELTTDKKHVERLLEPYKSQYKTLIKRLRLP